MSEKKFQMVCSHCGSTSISADSSSTWSVEKQDWETSNVFDKGHSCSCCDGECRIDEIPFDEWEAGLPEAFELEGVIIQAVEEPNGDYHATVIDEDGALIKRITEDPDWPGKLGSLEEAADAARKYVMKELG